MHDYDWNSLLLLLYAFFYVKKWLDAYDQVLLDQIGQDKNDGYYERFLSCLPKDEPRYAVLDLEFVKPNDPDNLTRRKLIFYSW